MSELTPCGCLDPNYCVQCLRAALAEKDDFFREYSLKAGDEFTKLKFELAVKTEECEQLRKLPYSNPRNHQRGEE